MLQIKSLLLVSGTQWSSYCHQNVSSGFWCRRKGRDTPSALPFWPKCCCPQAEQVRAVQLVPWAHGIGFSLFFFHASGTRSEYQFGFILRVSPSGISSHRVPVLQRGWDNCAGLIIILCCQTYRHLSCSSFKIWGIATNRINGICQ